MDDSILTSLYSVFPALTACDESIRAAAQALVNCYSHDGTLFVCGNGGSCSDADHICGELLKGFCRRRPMPEDERARLAELAPEEAALSDRLQCGLRAISLMHFPAAASAATNDLGYELGPAQLLYAMARQGDVLIGISTSGNAKNIRHAAAVARLKGVRLIGFTGEGGGWLGANADIAILAPARETYRVQEYHLPIYHALCRLVESHFFRD